MPFAYLLAVVALIFASRELFVFDPMGGALQLEDAAGSALDLFKEIAALCGTWATALFAAAGTIAVQRHKWNPAWNRFDDMVVLIIFVCGVATYYGIYLAYVEMLSMAAVKRLVPLGGQLEIALAVQYYAAFIGTILLGMVFVRMLATRGTR